jgi:hypothetical protein
VISLSLRGPRKRCDLWQEVVADPTESGKLATHTNGAIEKWGGYEKPASPWPIRFDSPRNSNHERTA